MYKRSTSFAICLLISMLVVVVVPQPTTSAQFVIASWSYPDEYGQGIEAVKAYQNISGSWESLTQFDISSGDPTTFEINVSVTGIKILVKCWLNNTVVEASDFEDGKNYLRHNMTLTIPSETIATLENFTYVTGTDSLDPMFYYQYEGIISFSPLAGLIYTAVVTYEIYM